MVQVIQAASKGSDATWLEFSCVMRASLPQPGGITTLAHFLNQSQEKNFTNYNILSRLKLIATPG
jgi:hypothetical protein